MEAAGICVRLVAWQGNFRCPLARAQVGTRGSDKLSLAVPCGLCKGDPLIHNARVYDNC